MACTTFGSPCLSKTSRLYTEAIECWGVVPRRGERGRPQSQVAKGTVLERFMLNKPIFVEFQRQKRISASKF
ncbi:hypothetical protein OROGR_029598 [Orobanche gracilis]